jgi:serine/threonine-protein kinase
VTPRSSLAFRIFFLTAAAVAASLGVALLLVSGEAARAADAGLARSLAATRAMMALRLESRARELLAVTERLAQVPSYVASLDEALRGGDHASLLDQAAELRDQLGADWVLVSDAGGTLRAWSGHPERHGDDLSQGALVLAALGGSPTTGAWVEPDDAGPALYQAAAVPVRVPGGGAVLGAVVAGAAVGPTLADSLRELTGAEILPYLRDTLGAAVHLGAVAPGAPSLAPLGAGDPDTVITLAGSNGRWVGAAVPLLTASGEPVGGLLALRSREAAIAPFARLRSSLWAALLVGLGMALLAAAFVARRVSRPVRELVRLTRSISGGEPVPVALPAGTDEIGELGQAFGRLSADLREQQRLVSFLRTGPREPVVSGPTAVGPPRPGERFAGRYQVRGVLGRGGMGIVYRAHDTVVGEDVALKLLHAEVAHAAPEVLDRFRQELRLARRITHRNVLRTHDLGEHGGLLFITMEYVEGTTLERLVRDRGRLPVPVVLALGRQLCRALEVAHEAGVIHRDIKPQNLLVDPAGVLKVMDFGIARLSEGGDTGAGLTQTGMAMGTPAYMAPEQLFGRPVDQRADIYAAGAVLYECLTGAPVFAGSSFGALLAERVAGPTPPLRERNPEVPEAVAAVIDRALAVDTDARWPSAAAMAEALGRAGEEANAP